MARTIGKLSALTVSRKNLKPGMHPDGGGLYLQVTPTGVKSWTFRFMQNGKERYMGLGPLHAVPLADARSQATECRRMRLDGIDPIEARDRRRNREKLEAATAMTFSACAEAYINSHKTGWRNGKHSAQWTATLKTYVEPIIGALPAQAVDTGLVLKVLQPIWAAKPETAGRVRGRMESILDWGAARGYRKGENPARWRGHLDKLLPRRSKVRRVQHHPALPYEQMGGFMKALQGQDGVAASAFQFLILTVTRTGETIGARWPEIDLDAKLWTVPPERTKPGRELRVPLSAAAIAILRRMLKMSDGKGYVFPGGKRGKPLSSMAMLMLLRRMERTDITAHGFRSTFRDWAAERTNYPRDVAEMALGHVVGDKVEAAYRRGDLFGKRERLMEDWASFCSAVKPAAKLIALRP